MTSMTTVICGNKKCRKEFQARTADVNRGWGKFCSKSCKAKKQGRLPMSKETRAMWREYNREERARKDEAFWDQMAEHEAILDDLGETADDKWGDSGVYSK